MLNPFAMLPFHVIRPTYRLRHCHWCGILAAWIVFVFINSVSAQDQIVIFGANYAGVSKAMTNWRLGVAGGSDVINRGMIFMESNQGDEINLPFTVMDPLTNGQLSAASQTEISTNLSMANIAGNNLPLMIGSGTGVLLATSATGGNLIMNWPVAGSGFTLESSPSLGAGAIWTPVNAPSAILDTNNQVTIQSTNAAMFFRLQR